MLLPCSVWLSCVLPCVSAAVRSGDGMRAGTAALAAHSCGPYAVALLCVVVLRAAMCQSRSAQWQRHARGIVPPADIRTINAVMRAHLVWKLGL
jgi:hypothetical protein